MRIQLQLDDDLVDIYKVHAGKRTLEQALTSQLVRFQSYGPHDVAMVLRPKALGALDAVLGVGSTVDVEHLQQAVVNLARLRVGSIEIPVTPKQWEIVQARAEKQGKSLETVCKDAAERVLSEIAGF